jgi:aminoglycoside 6'-N-acetyltransferase
VILRLARLGDASLLESWDKDEDVIASSGADAKDGDDWRDEDWRSEIAAAPSWRDILIAEENGRPIGVIVDIDPALEETHYWGDCGPGLRAFDIWIGAAADRSRGLGAAMMRLAAARAFTDPRVAAIVIDPLLSNVRAIRFYRRIGFQDVGERWFAEDHCLVMKLSREAFLADASRINVRGS